MPGLQGVVHLPAGHRVQPGQVEPLRVVADAQVSLRGGEHEVGGDVLDADTADPPVTVLRAEVTLSRPSLTHISICREENQNCLIFDLIFNALG